MEQPEMRLKDSYKQLPATSERMDLHRRLSRIRS